MVHELKTIAPYFDEVRHGNKTFEIRKDDRGFKKGDILVLREWVKDKYTERIETFVVSYILRDAEDFGLKKGFVILGLGCPL